MVGQQLQAALGQAFIVGNKPGAGGSIAGSEVVRAAPDSYTLLFSSNSAVASNVALLKNMPHDPLKDFSPIAGVAETALALMVKPSFPAKNLQEFIAYARERPGKLSAGYGSSSSRVIISMLNKLRDDSPFPERRGSVLDNLQELEIFGSVVSAGSMSAAARELDLSLAVVSKRVAALEQRLGARLLQRTTRRQSLTSEGEVFHEHCIRILAEVAGAEAPMLDQRGAMTGLLTLTATPAFGRQYLAPLVSEFQAEHPAVSVRLLLTDDVVDLVAHRVILAFRFGVLADSSMKARRVAPNFRVLCAAPSYLQRHGAPTSLEGLARHTCIVFGASLDDQWVFLQEGRTTSVRVKGRLSVNDGEVAQALAVDGAGLIYKSVWEIGTHLRAGRLVAVMTDHLGPSKPLQLVFPGGLLPTRVRRFIDLTLERLPAIGPSLAWQTESARSGDPYSDPSLSKTVSRTSST